MSYFNTEQVAQLLRPTEITNTCVLWTGAKNRRGYGVVRIGGKTYLAHRLMHALFVGPLVDGMEIDHLCFVTGCVSPAHLEQVTPRENTRRARAVTAAANRARSDAMTECKNGHPVSPENSYYPRNASYRKRMCRPCMREQWRRWKARQKDAVA